MLRFGALLGMLAKAFRVDLPTRHVRTESFAMRDTASTTLGQSARHRLQAKAGDSGFRPLPVGVDALVARIVLADAAERSLDVQYYIWRNDLTGRLLTDALLRAADRGVRVRILVDDVGTKSNDEVLLCLDSHPNVQIRLFNPVALRSFRGLGMLTDFTRTNRRMHNKAFVADNQRAVLGGRNIGDEYFEAQVDIAFGDLDVLLLGPVVDKVSTSFDTYWNAPMSAPIRVLAGRSPKAEGLTTLRQQLSAFVQSQVDTPYVHHARSEAARHLAVGSEEWFWGQGRLLVDDPLKTTRPPEDTRGHLLPQLAKEIATPHQELLIVSPYFIPGQSGVAWLRMLVERGARVTVLTNSLASTDVGAVHAGYQRYREALLDGGVRLFELKPSAIEYGRTKGKGRLITGSKASLHAKTFVFDRRTVFIGSMNLDPRSLHLNTEIGVVCDSEPMAIALANGVEAGLDSAAWQVQRIVGADGKSTLAWTETTADGVHRHTDEPGVSAWRRLAVWFLGLLPVESQL